MISTANRKPTGKPGCQLNPRGGKEMCKLCDEGKPQDHTGSQLGRRDFLKASTATAAAAAGMSLFTPRPAAAQDDDAPGDNGRRGRGYVIPGGPGTSLEPGGS